MKPIVVRVSRWRYATPLLGSLAIVALSMWALRYRPSSAAWILFVAFLMCVSLFAQLLLQSRVRLIVDNLGIFDPRWEIGTVRWADVERVFVREDNGEEVVCVLLSSTGRRHSESGVLARKLGEATHLAGYGDFSVNATRLGIRADDIVEFGPKRHQCRALKKPNSDVLRRSYEDQTRLNIAQRVATVSGTSSSRSPHAVLIRSARNKTLCSTF